MQNEELTLINARTHAHTHIVSLGIHAVSID